MDEEKRPSPEGEKEPAPPRDRSRRQRSAYLYLAALVAVAFLLLLLAYLMQQRNSREILGNLSDLRESMGSIRSIDEIAADNRALREENAALREQLGEAQGQLVDAQGGLSQERQRAEQAEEQTAALLLLEELEYLCEAERYDDARAAISDGLETVLSDLDRDRDPDLPTLTQRYQAVLDALPEESAG